MKEEEKEYQNVITSWTWKVKITDSQNDLDAVDWGKIDLIIQKEIYSNMVKKLDEKLANLGNK